MADDQPKKPRNDFASDIVLSLDIPRPRGYWIDALKRQTRPFANFVRELLTLVVLTGALGALAERHPSNGTITLATLAYVATGAMILNTIGLRARFQFVENETGAHRWIAWILNSIFFIVFYWIVMGWIGDVRQALVADNLVDNPAPSLSAAPSRP